MAAGDRDLEEVVVVEWGWKSGEWGWKCGS